MEYIGIYLRFKFEINENNVDKLVILLNKYFICYITNLNYCFIRYNNIFINEVYIPINNRGSLK